MWSHPTEMAVQSTLTPEVEEILKASVAQAVTRIREKLIYRETKS